MTIKYNILPMSVTRRIVFIVYDGFELLDMSGPASVFSAANAVSGTDAYRTELVSIDGGAIRSNTGVTVETKAIGKVGPDSLSTVLVMGADKEELRRELADGAIAEWLSSVGMRVERVGSVCTGAFILAAAGLLSSRQATTHWAASKAFSLLHSDVEVREDALYVVDEHVWTSAGVTTGIDMALAIISEDLGHSVMRSVAKRLVLYVQRPGGQSQFSALLEAQSRTRSFSDLIAWMGANLHLKIKVADMAERAGMSERTFARRFTAETGVPPAKFLERLRLYRGKSLIESGMAMKQVAREVGYGSRQGFRSSFEDAFGLSPSQYARMNVEAPAGSPCRHPSS